MVPARNHSQKNVNKEWAQRESLSLIEVMMVVLVIVRSKTVITHVWPCMMEGRK